MKNILVKDLDRLPKHQVIDVRTAEEFSEGHIPNALNFPVEDIISNKKLPIDSSIPLLVYCESGARSQLACQILDMAGHQTFNLLGGFVSWSIKKPSHD